MKVKYAIVDDDPQALESVEYYLKNISIDGLEMEMVGKQYDLDANSESDRELLTNIDVLFLDIMLRDKTAWTLLVILGMINQSLLSLLLMMSTCYEQFAFQYLITS